MKAPVSSWSEGTAGGASCSERVREGGMASDARIWDWIMQRKEPRSRSSLHPSVAASLAPLPFGQAAKRDLDITTLKTVPFAMDLDELCLGRFSQVHLSNLMDRGTEFKKIYLFHYLESTDSKDVREIGLTPSSPLSLE